jgi:hypothetical protein
MTNHPNRSPRPNPGRNPSPDEIRAALGYGASA